MTYDLYYFIFLLFYFFHLTGSMGSFLSEAKRNIKKITEEISDQYPGSKI